MALHTQAVRALDAKRMRALWSQRDPGWSGVTSETYSGLWKLSFLHRVCRDKLAVTPGRQVLQDSQVLWEPCTGIGWQKQSCVRLRKEGRERVGTRKGRCSQSAQC